jgi:NAD(P)-dependent dehydrogenase (short-subunit alcohol dehydrogenase family)
MNASRVAVITGATGVLGRVLATDLAADGYDLALLGSNAGRLEALRDELGLETDRTLTVGSDLRDAAAAASAVEAVYERFGAVDALAHLVGGWTGGTTVRDSTDEPFASMLDQHLWTTLNVTRELAPRMVEQGSGRIVAVSSPMASAPEAGMSAYAAGKAAEEALLLTLAQEVAGSGVTVNVIRVRSIDPSADGSAGSDEAQATTAAEICAAIRYLFKDEARIVNGRRIPLHRGIG